MNMPLKKLRLNGHEVSTIGSQLIWDFELPDGDSDARDTLSEEEVRPRALCDCGAQHVGIQPYVHGHSEWCQVHEDKTPVM